MSVISNIITTSIFVLLALSVGIATSTYVQSNQGRKSQAEINNHLLEANKTTLEEIQRLIETNHEETRKYNQCLADAFIEEATAEKLNNCIRE